MKPIIRDEFVALIKKARIKSRLVRDLRFVPEEISDWEARDFLAVMTKSGAEGAFMTPDHRIKPFELHRRVAKSGRVTPIICEFCSTWQRGSNSAIITFTTKCGGISHLVCWDLMCSFHVRDMTTASKLSRVQLREDITPEQRVQRLQTKLDAILSDLY